MPGFFDTTVSQAGVAWRRSTRYPRTVLVREHDRGNSGRGASSDGTTACSGARVPISGHARIAPP